MNQSRALFSPKKRKPIEIIPTDNDENIRCELINLKRFDNSGLLVTNAKLKN